MTLDISIITYILSGLSFLILIIVFWIIWYEVRLRRLLRGKDGKSLEAAIVLIQKEINHTKKFQEEVRESLENIEKRLSRSIQGVGVVRFNPFKGTSGSNQSFSAAFLDEKNNGIVLSTLYSRERVSMFAKPIKDGSSEYELTSEEKEAMSHAQHGNS